MPTMGVQGVLFTCSSHGSATKAAREWGQLRLGQAQRAQQLQRDFAEMHERLKDPEASRARGEAVLSEVAKRLVPARQWAPS
jgi:hypothetical protein